MQEPQPNNLLPQSADVARRIYRNAKENRILRSIHRLLVKLETGETPGEKASRILPDADKRGLTLVRASDIDSGTQDDDRGADHE